MSKDTILDWSTTAASNTDIGGIGIQGTNLVSGFDNAFRELMEQQAAEVTRHVVKTVGSYTPVKADHNQYWRCTGAVTLNLTAAATLTDGWRLWVRANGGAVTIDPNAAETIDGSATLVLADGQTAMVICTGSTFYTVMAGTAGSAGAFPMKQDGRLTLESGVAASTTDQLAKGTIYYTPYIGNVISLYSGTGWVNRTFSEISLALSATSGKPYDVFVYDNSGAAALETLVWTDDTTRATALVRQDGVLCKTGALTRRYVGTFYASASNQCEDSLKKRYVWNMYNRVFRKMEVLDGTDSWTYTTGTFRQANNAATNQLDFVRGLDEDAVRADVHSSFTNTTINVAATSAIGLDSTNTKATDCMGAQGYNATTAQLMSLYPFYLGLPGVGRHVLTWLEHSTATGTTTWYGDAGVPTLFKCGIQGSSFF